MNELTSQNSIISKEHDRVLKEYEKKCQELQAMDERAKKESEKTRNSEIILTKAIEEFKGKENEFALTLKECENKEKLLQTQIDSIREENEQTSEELKNKFNKLAEEKKKDEEKTKGMEEALKSKLNASGNSCESLKKEYADLKELNEKQISDMKESLKGITEQFNELAHEKEEMKKSISCKKKENKVQSIVYTQHS